MLQMGFPLHRLDLSRNSEREPCLRSSLGRLQVSRQKTKELHSLAGNSMHLRAIAVAIAAAITVTWLANEHF